MGVYVDRGFWHAIALAVLQDNPESKEALEIAEKPAFRVSIGGNTMYFETESEMKSYLNSREFENGMVRQC